jgi:hypothetical protein
MTEDIAAAFLAVPLTLLFGCLAVYVVGESRRIHAHPGDGQRSNRTRDRLSLGKRGSTPSSGERSGSDG